jgi:hypothetical protein
MENSGRRLHRRAQRKVLAKSEELIAKADFEQPPIACLGRARVSNRRLLFSLLTLLFSGVVSAGTLGANESFAPAPLNCGKFIPAALSTLRVPRGGRKIEPLLGNRGRFRSH